MNLRVYLFKFERKSEREREEEEEKKRNFVCDLLFNVSLILFQSTSRT
jgi:hypothetical protein